jgi:hypothetical protein
MEWYGLNSFGSREALWMTFVDMAINEEWRLLGCYAVWLL